MNIITYVTLRCQFIIENDSFLLSDCDVDEIGKKIVKLRGKLSQRQLAAKAGIEQATLSRIERGEMDMVSPHVRRIAKALNVDPASLISDVPNVEPIRLTGRPVPVLDYVQAGLWTGVAPNFRDEEMTDHVIAGPECSNGTFALKIRGESMLPVFHDGDVVVIDPAVTPRPEDFVVAKDKGGEATFKRYHSRGTDPVTGDPRFDLVPMNDAYPTLHSSEQHIEIVGTMMLHLRYRKR